MAELYFPFDSVSGDREYHASDLADFFADLISNGVVAADVLGVTWSSGMTVTVSAGKAWIAGHQYKNTAPLNFTLAIGDATPRIDRVVIRYNAATRDIKAAILKGTPASDPTPPALERNTAGFYELCLANIRVPASAAALASENITDTRSDNSVCGIVRCLVEKLDASDFFANCQDEFDEWFAAKKSAANAITLSRLQAQIDAMQAREESYKIRTIRPAADGYLWGDVNNDGAINNQDIILVDRYAAGTAEPTAAQLAAADFDGDGVVSEGDSQFLATMRSRMRSGQRLEKEEIHYNDGTKKIVWTLVDNAS